MKRLAAILRVADGFDRGHSAAVDNVRAEWGEDGIVLTATPATRGGNVQLETWGADRKSRLLAKVAGAPVEVTASGVLKLKAG